MPSHRSRSLRLRGADAGHGSGKIDGPGTDAGQVERLVGRGVDMFTDKVGGAARRRALLLLASVLALGSADTGAVGALAPELERSLHISNVDIGLLVTVSAITAAVAMLPVGWATDRWCRTRMLVISIATWGLAEAVSGAALSFTMLLLVRLALGALTATTGPTVASLTGDLFPASERSRMYGFILTGELLGAGLGLLVAGLVASWANWRVSFIVLALPSFVLAWALRRYLPEPARGGANRLEPGSEELIAAEDADGGPGEDELSPSQTEGPAPVVVTMVERHGTAPHPEAILEQDPMTLSWIQALRYVFRVRTNVMVIVASALGYFFFSGLETFTLIYLKGHYGIDQGVATVIVVAVGGAAVAGTIIGGRLSDSLLVRGRVDGRLIVAATGFVITAIVMAPALISSLVAISLPLFLVAGFALAAPNPGLDAARLDIMPSRMWGRAEAVRSLLRNIFQAFAPLIFGLTSVVFGGHSQGLATGARGSDAAVNAAQAAGLEPTFLIMLVPVLAAGAVVWWGRRHYPGDVAAAIESERRFPPE